MSQKKVFYTLALVLVMQATVKSQEWNPHDTRLRVSQQSEKICPCQPQEVINVPSSSPTPVTKVPCPTPTPVKEVIKEPCSTPAPVKEVPCSTPAPTKEVIKEPIPCSTQAPIKEVIKVPCSTPAPTKEVPCTNPAPVKEVIKEKIPCTTPAPVEKVPCSTPAPVTEVIKEQIPCSTPRPVKEEPVSRPTTEQIQTVATSPVPITSNKCVQGEIFPTSSGSCDQYLVCHNGDKILMNCPAGLGFNERTKSCDWFENIPACKSKPVEVLTCPNGIYGLNDDFTYKYRYGESCTKYVACHKRRPRLFACDEGYAFDIISRSCVYSQYVSNCRD